MSRPVPVRAALARRPTARHLVLVALLVAAWCALWGEISAANVLSGLVVATGIVALGLRNRTFGDATAGRIRLGPLVRLGLVVAVDLARSTVTVAREVVTGGQGDEAVIAINVPPAARRHYLVLVVGITVSPGTAVVDADPDNDVVYVHLLQASARAEVEAHVRLMVELASAAFPDDDRGTSAVGSGDTS